MREYNNAPIDVKPLLEERSKIETLINVIESGQKLFAGGLDSIE
jgi:hypothetical protein